MKNDGATWSRSLNVTRGLITVSSGALQDLEAAFAQFGPVAKAVVVSDAHANASRRLVALQC